MAIKYRQELGRTLTYAEGDENFRTLAESIEKTLAEYPTLTAALADDIPDGVVFLVNDGDDAGYWRRDSSIPEGAEFLRRYPVNNHAEWKLLNATPGSVSFPDGNLRIDREIPIYNTVKGTRAVLFENETYPLTINITDGHLLCLPINRLDSIETIQAIEVDSLVEIPYGSDTKDYLILKTKNTSIWGSITGVGLFDELVNLRDLHEKTNSIQRDLLPVVELQRGSDYEVVQGGISPSGTNQNRSDRIRTSYIEVGHLSRVEFPTDLEFNVFYYNSNQEYIQTLSPTWLRGHSDNIPMVPGVGYIRVVFRYPDSSEIAPSDLVGGDIVISYVKTIGDEVVLPDIPEGVMSQTHVIDGEYFLLDTANSTITIPQTMYVICNNIYRSVPADVIDFSDVPGSTKFIFFILSTRKFIVTSESVGAPIDMDYSFVGYIRRLNVHINGNYTINGKYINGRWLDDTPDEEVSREVTAISTSYEFTGQVEELPQNVEDVYATYDSLVEDFPQYVTKEVLGKSREVIKMDINSTDRLPFSVSVSSVDSLSIGMTVVIEGQEFEVAEIAENSTPSIGDHILLIPTTTSDIYHTGSIMSVEGDELTTYSRRWIRFEATIDQNPDYRLFISFVDHDNLFVEGVLHGTQTPPTSGTLTYGNETLANFSNLTEIEGTDINCYTFDFSNRRDESDIKNRLFFIGGVHGHEKKALLGHMTFFNELCRNWRGSEELEALRNIRYTVIPAVNPWGIDKGRNHNAGGVDLNRNSEKDFPSTSPLYYRWSGPAPESEPETVLVNDKLEENLPTVFAFLDSHNDSSMLGGLMMTELASEKLGNALSRNLHTNIIRTNSNIPTFMFGWGSGSNTVWSLKQNPTVGDSVYGSKQNLNNPKTIDSVAGGDIIVEGVTYARDEGSDVNYTNLYNALPSSPTGSFARQANSLGVDESFLSEVGGDYFMTSEEARKLQIDITGNVIASLAKGLLF